MTYIDTATTVKKQVSNHNTPQKIRKTEKNKKLHTFFQILRSFFLSLFFYSLSFIISFIPVIIEEFYEIINKSPNSFKINVDAKFIELWILDSLKNIGTLYISISFLFILLMDFAKNSIINKHKIGTISICIIIAEILFGCIGMIFFCLFMGGVSENDISNKQSIFVNFTKLYLGIAIVSLIANTIIENVRSSPHSRKS